MTVKITIQKKPYFNSTRDDFAMFDVDDNNMTEQGIIEEFTKVIRELGWFKSQEGCLNCDGEFSKCGTSTAESDSK